MIISLLFQVESTILLCRFISSNIKKDQLLHSKTESLVLKAFIFSLFYIFSILPTSSSPHSQHAPPSRTDPPPVPYPVYTPHPCKAPSSLLQA